MVEDIFEKICDNTCTWYQSVDVFDLFRRSVSFKLDLPSLFKKNGESGCKYKVYQVHLVH